MIEWLSNWLFLGVLSCILLGFYDVLKKVSLKENDIITVLFYSSIFSGIFLFPFLLSSYFSLTPEDSFWYISQLSYFQHILIFIKSFALTSVWMLAFKSMQNLPISVVTPIWATDSIWTFAGAILIFNEKITLYQWTALFIIVFSFIFLSRIGKKEGIYFHKNRYVIYLIIATVLGTCASLYDKYLMSFLRPLDVLVWFSFYNILIFSFYKVTNSKRGNRKSATNWSIKKLGIIALIGIVVSSQDLAFFYALTLNDSMVSVLTAIKRSSAAVSFLIGAMVFKEHLLQQKFYSLMGIILGVFLLLVTSDNN